ncbi:MAG TPA: hypothetical protein VHZ24_23020 [Pirellulales bacterium]|nr:hypothetical protein [Pirellulales bacterium]
MNKLAKLGRKGAKALLTANLASVIRLLRCGPAGLDRRLSETLAAIDPFGSAPWNWRQPGCATALPEAFFRGRIDKGTQILLSLTYKSLVQSAHDLPSLEEVEFQSFSQHREDGVMLYLFSVLGTTNKVCVEICAGDCIECNTSNLVVNHGWRAAMFDGSEANIARGRWFYKQQTVGLDWHPPRMQQAWITAENVNQLIETAGVRGEIDLLSLDIDGNDYWIWEAIDCVNPRVVCLEFNQGLGTNRAVTVPYDPQFVFDWNHPFFGGASLPAFVKLGRSKGYRLIGAESMGVNAFFLRDGVGDHLFPEVNPADCPVRGCPERQWSDYAWVDV